MPKRNFWIVTTVRLLNDVCVNRVADLCQGLADGVVDLLGILALHGGHDEYRLTTKGERGHGKGEKMRKDQ